MGQGQLYELQQGQMQGPALWSKQSLGLNNYLKGGCNEAGVGLFFPSN